MRSAIPIFFLAATLGACSFKPAKIFSSYTNLEVHEVGRSMQCGAAGSDAAASLFGDTAQVQAWLAARSVNLTTGALADAPYAIVEMGQRPTGGYGLAVSRSAVLRGELLILSATFVSPSPESIVSQALTSPCVLVRLPPGRYRTIEVQDQTGVVRTTGTAASATVTP